MGRLIYQQIASQDHGQQDLPCLLALRAAATSSKCVPGGVETTTTSILSSARSPAGESYMVASGCCSCASFPDRCTIARSSKPGVDWMYGIWNTLAERPKPMTPTWYVFDMVTNEGFVFFFSNSPLYSYDDPGTVRNARRMFRVNSDFKSRGKHDFQWWSARDRRRKRMLALPPTSVRNTP